MMDYEPPVSQLLTLGGPKTLFGLGKGSDYAEFGFRAEHVRVTGQNDYRHGLNAGKSGSAEVWAPMHAWRALAEMQPVVAIDAMLTIHKAVLEETDSDQPTDDLIDLCVRVGGAALPSLERYLSDTSMERARMAVAESIGKIGVEHPEQRTCCVAMLARQFGTLRGKRRLR